MYRILVGIDEDDNRAKAQAREIVEMPLDHDEIEVILLHSFEDNPSGASIGQVSSVRRAKEILDNAGVDVELEADSDEPAVAITNHADRIDADLIVVSGRKRTPTGKVLFGSVTQAVILDSNRSVLVCNVK